MFAITPWIGGGFAEGFGATNDAGLKIVPGSHLFRENGGHGDLWNIGEAKETRELDPSKADSVLRAGWLRGKRNTITGSPLEIERPSLPPGSMASILHHTLHGVHMQCTFPSPLISPYKDQKSLCARLESHAIDPIIYHSALMIRLSCARRCLIRRSRLK